MNRILIILVIAFTSDLSYSQTQADWWYFGNKAGVHFTSSGPVADTNGQLFTGEGCASMSDLAGNLLFYTDGSTVWNAEHEIMPNGTGLLGNSTSTQSAIIVPRPGDFTQFYVITVPFQPTTGMRYSLVDMDYESGLGDVDTAEKNILIRNGIREKVTSTVHSNGHDFWVLTAPAYSDTILAYEVTSAGINLTPIISETGLSTINISGYMKVNPQSELLVNQAEFYSESLLHKFDNSTGQVSNSLKWQIDSGAQGYNYGAEFSPNGEVLYVAPRNGQGTLRQYDVSVFDSTLIHSSETVISDSTSTAALQLGPDHKIYMVGALDSSLHRINDPNELGLACNFELHAVDLGGRFGYQGLPPFIARLVQGNIRAKYLCSGDSTNFQVDFINVDSVLWDFGDPASGSFNTSSGDSVFHVFTDTGDYTISASLYYGLTPSIDTVFQQVYIYPRQSISLGKDTTLCLGDTFRLSIEQDYSTYLWHDGSTTSEYQAAIEEQIYATVFGICDTVRDTINVGFVSPIAFDLGLDTSICEGDSFSVSVQLDSSAQIFWSSGDTTATIQVNESGLYELNIINACGSYRDTINWTVIPLVGGPLLPPDTVSCSDNEIVLTRPDSDSIVFVWSDSSSSMLYVVDSSATVWLSASNDCGIWVDTMNIIFNGGIQTELGEDTTICPGDTVALFSGDSAATFVWNTGSTVDALIVSPMETFNYIVTITLDQCEKVEQKMITIDETLCESDSCLEVDLNVFSPNSDGINDVFKLDPKCQTSSYDLFIYNRWGQLLFHSSSRNLGWDGTINGVQAKEGTYFYLVNYNAISEEQEKTSNGSFTLMR